MLSAQDILSIEFEKGIRGYRPEAVHAFLAQIAAQLEKVENEKADIEKKLYILAEKVEEYRSDEDMLKTAMINAQRMGENVIREAKQKADSIQREADLRNGLIEQKAKEKLKAEEANFVILQEKVMAFKAQVLAVYKNHIESLSELPIMNSQEDCAEISLNSIEEENLQPQELPKAEIQEPVIINEPDDIVTEIEKEITTGFNFDNFEKEVAKTRAKNAENSQATDILKDATEIDFSSADEPIKSTVYSFDDEFAQDDNNETDIFEMDEQNEEEKIEKLPLRKSSIFEKYDDINFND